MLAALHDLYRLLSHPRTPAVLGGVSLFAWAVEDERGAFSSPMLLLLVFALCALAWELGRGRLKGECLMALGASGLALSLVLSPLPSGELLYRSGVPTETYVASGVTHHLGYWLEGVDVAGKNYDLSIRRAGAEAAPVTIPLSGGRLPGDLFVRPVSVKIEPRPGSLRFGWRKGEAEGEAEVSVPGSVQIEGQTLHARRSAADWEGHGPAVWVEEGAEEGRWVFARFPDHEQARSGSGFKLRWIAASAARSYRFTVRPMGPMDWLVGLGWLFAALGLMGLVSVRWLGGGAR